MNRSLQVALLIAVVLLGGYLFQQHFAAARDATSQRAGNPVAGTGPGAAERLGHSESRLRRSSGNPPTVPRIVLPPIDAPLAPEMPALLRAVRQGDVHAMCRLSYELQRCGPTLEARRELEARWTDELLDPERAKGPGETSNDSLMKMIAKTTAEREELERICTGVKQPPGLEPWRLLRDAARAGHVPSMVRFATNFPTDNQHFLADIDGLKAYRDEGPGFLQRAAEMGDPFAAYQLMWNYMGNGMLSNTGRVPDSPGLALAYALALRDAADEKTQKILAAQEARLRRRLSAVQVREAERTAARIAPIYSTSRGFRLDLEAVKIRNSPEACN